MGCLREITCAGRTLRQWIDTTRNVELVVVLAKTWLHWSGW